MTLHDRLRLQVLDLKALIEAAHEAGALAAVDNSILTYLYDRPLDLGADISMTSATKFVSGHSDTTGNSGRAGGLAIVKKASSEVQLYEAS